MTGNSLHSLYDDYTEILEPKKKLPRESRELCEDAL